MAEEKDKGSVEIEPAEEPTLLAPQGWQDHNIAVEPDPYLNVSPGDTLERVLQTEMVVDIGRGALTFRSGDKVFIQDGAVVKAETTEGITYEFTKGREAALERRKNDIQAEMRHQNLSAKSTSMPDAPASPAPRPQTETQLASDRMGGIEETEEAITNQPHGAFEEGMADPEDAVPVSAEELPAANPAPAEQPPDKGPERDEEGHPLHPHGGPPGQEDKPQPKEEEGNKQPREKGKFVKKEDS